MHITRLNLYKDKTVGIEVPDIPLLRRQAKCIGGKHKDVVQEKYARPWLGAY